MYESESLTVSLINCSCFYASLLNVSLEDVYLFTFLSFYCILLSVILISGFLLLSSSDSSIIPLLMYPLMHLFSLLSQDAFNPSLSPEGA